MSTRENLHAEFLTLMDKCKEQREAGNLKAAIGFFEAALKINDKILAEAGIAPTKHLAGHMAEEMRRSA